MQQAISDRTLSFLKGTVAPGQGDMALPPSIVNRTTMSKKFDVQGNWEVNDDLLGGAAIKSSSGCLVWLPGRGMHSLTRYGFVAPGTTTWVPAVNFTIQYMEEVALPYESTAGPLISPDAAENFTWTRIFAGAIRVESTTVPIGNTALNGTFAGGTFEDLRDVMQDGAGHAYSVPNIVQQTLIAKDAYKQIPVKDGMVMTIGSDIVPLLSPPDPDKYVDWHAGVTMINFNAPGGHHNISGVNVVDLVWWGWISPYNIQAMGANQSIQIDNVNPYATPRLDLNISQPVASIPVAYWARLEFRDIYVTVNGSTGDTQYTSVITSEDRYFNGGVAGEFHVSHHADMAAVTGREVTGIWIGTQVALSYYSETMIQIPLPTYIGGGLAIMNLYCQGELGPARIIRWDHLSKGQVISVRGDILMEAVPQGSIAPYVTANTFAANMSFQVNAFPMLQAIYNSSFPIFRRLYVGTEYDHIVRNILPELTAEYFTRHESSPEIEMAASASGIFSDIGGELGGLFGKRGRTIGSSLGALGDIGTQLMGRRFGSAAGQFGSAAGQFGSAAGQFGEREYD